MNNLILKFFMELLLYVSSFISSQTIMPSQLNIFFITCISNIVDSNNIIIKQKIISKFPVGIYNILFLMFSIILQNSKAVIGGNALLALTDQT